VDENVNVRVADSTVEIYYNKASGNIAYYTWLFITNKGAQSEKFKTSTDMRTAVRLLIPRFVVIQLVFNHEGSNVHIVCPVYLSNPSSS